MDEEVQTECHAKQFFGSDELASKENEDNKIGVGACMLVFFCAGCKTLGAEGLPLSGRSPVFRVCGGRTRQGRRSGAI
jgi:hypothetical protein